MVRSSFLTFFQKPVFAFKKKKIPKCEFNSLAELNVVRFLHLNCTLYLFNRGLLSVFWRFIFTSHQKVIFTGTIKRLDLKDLNNQPKICCRELKENTKTWCCVTLPPANKNSMGHFSAVDQKPAAGLNLFDLQRQTSDTPSTSNLRQRYSRCQKHQTEM